MAKCSHSPAGHIKISIHVGAAAITQLTCDSQRVAITGQHQK
jgi:hypothetical protein